MDLIKALWFANKKRKAKNKDFSRRLVKLSEEVGEVCQAFYATTSKKNSKKKTWDNVREELIDVILIALDLLLTEMPDEAIKGDKYQYIKSRIESMYLKKMEDKWSSKNDHQGEEDDNE